MLPPFLPATGARSTLSLRSSAATRPPTPAPAAAALEPSRRKRGWLLGCACFFAFLSAFAQSPTRLSSESPILNWRLPLFTADGSRREALVQGSEALVLADRNVAIKDLILHLFTRDQANRIETILASPSAKVLPAEQAVVGEGIVRVINDQFEATGNGWRYDHAAKKVSLHQNVRVTFRAQIDDLLK